MTDLTITGSRGFIGSNLRKILRLSYEEVDLSLGISCKDVVGRFGTLLHLAAYKREEESFWNPEKYIDNNISDLARLLSRNNFSRVIFASSMAVYDSNGDLEPLSIYGITKLAGEKLVKTYCSTYWILRIAQPYGPYDTSSVFAKLASCKLNNEIFRIYESRSMKRDYFHVSHVVNIIDRTLRGAIKPGIYNIGSGKEVVPYDFLKYLCDKYNIKYDCVSLPSGSSLGYIPTKDLLVGGQGDLEEEWLKYLL